MLTNPKATFIFLPIAESDAQLETSSKLLPLSFSWQLLFIGELMVLYSGDFICSDCPIFWLSISTRWSPNPSATKLFWSCWLYSFNLILLFCGPWVLGVFEFEADLNIACKQITCWHEQLKQSSCVQGILTHEYAREKAIKWFLPAEEVGSLCFVSLDHIGHFVFLHDWLK